MAASNSVECLKAFVGLRVVGVLERALPLADLSIRSHTRTVIFEDGRGLTLSSNGSFWAETADDVAIVFGELRALQSEIDSAQKAMTGR